ncbi:WXG100 family type VII secretion target [Streptomyces sp. NPDC019890]|uniref:WXG100 family type VII secretion target n=2 Tax=unclassified Streptomyces TaxID=2593676 RepID=UPI00384D7B26
MPDMSWSDFRVNLGHLKEAIGTVRGQSGHIASTMSRLAGEFETVGAEWQTPSSATLEEVQRWFARSQTELHDLLEEVVRRMQVAYDNYHEMETANYNNMT